MSSITLVEDKINANPARSVSIGLLEDKTIKKPVNNVPNLKFSNHPFLLMALPPLLSQEIVTDVV
ncbi:hypothetical protein COJ85_30270 [Bacillus sp. AFS076308]|nr:hypothetical protein COJ85_30270 [Bacillus sp. AFS076308]PGV46000.1 hypothetical protein COD92_30400 [Bacillus sp. AFS037270]